MAGLQETTKAMTDLMIHQDDDPDHRQKVEAIIKNIHTISLEVKKMRELSQLLLCDLTLGLNLPVRTEDRQEANSPVFEDPVGPDGSLDAMNFSA